VSTKQELRDYVRLFLDVDSTDIPDTLIDFWGQQALNRIAASADWPFLEKVYTFNTSAGTQTYTYATIGADLRQPDVIIGPRYNLQNIEHALALAQFPANVTTQGEPQWWSEEASVVYLWPKPNATYAMTVTGYRTLLTWASQTTPDIPSDFHEAIGSFLLAKAHLQQGDTEIAREMDQDFERQLDSQRKRYLNGTTVSPLVVNSIAELTFEPTIRWPFD
jgi:hypothetical protein